MISDEDRAKIIERIQAEIEIRKELTKNEDDNKKSRWSWVESKLSLLVIGAILTGVLIPIFQATQETIKWARQNKYENLKYRIDSARTAMKDLTITHAFVAEAFERARTISSSDSKNNKFIENYRSQIIEMHKRRFQQNAKFVGVLGLIEEKDRELIQTSFNDYLSTAQQLTVILENISKHRMGYEESSNDKEENLEKTQESLSKDANKYYDQTLIMLKNYLHRLEVQSEKYFKD